MKLTLGMATYLKIALILKIRRHVGHVIIYVVWRSELTATIDAKYKRPKSVATITVKIVAFTGVLVRFQTLAKYFPSGSAFYCT